MRGLYYALAGVHNDLGYLARLGRYHAWRMVMAIAWRIDIWFVRLHTHAFSEASRLRRRDDE